MRLENSGQSGLRWVGSAMPRIPVFLSACPCGRALSHHSFRELTTELSHCDAGKIIAEINTFQTHQNLPLRSTECSQEGFMKQEQCPSPPPHPSSSPVPVPQQPCPSSLPGAFSQQIWFDQICDSAVTASTQICSSWAGRSPEPGWAVAAAGSHPGHLLPSDHCFPGNKWGLFLFIDGFHHEGMLIRVNMPLPQRKHMEGLQEYFPAFSLGIKIYYLVT